MVCINGIIVNDRKLVGSFSHTHIHPPYFGIFKDRYRWNRFLDYITFSISML